MLMLLDEKTLMTLQRLGLTYYGARVYATLVSIGPCNATKLSAESEVPRTKIYDVLKRLEVEKWISVGHTRPITYNARYPREVIDERKSDFDSEVASVSSMLSTAFDQRMEKENPQVWLIRGMDNVTLKTLDMIVRARRCIKFLGSLYSREEIGQIQEHISQVRKSGIVVQIISRSQIDLEDGPLDIEGALSPAASEMKVRSVPLFRYLTIDDKEALMTFTRVENGVPDTDSVFAIWIPNTSVAFAMDNNFNTVWSSVK